MGAAACVLAIVIALSALVLVLPAGQYECPGDDVVLASRAYVGSSSSCGEHGTRPVTPPASDLSVRVLVDRDAASNWTVRATVRATTPTAGPTADAVRQGTAAADPSAFVREVLGEVAAGQPLTWSAPTLTSTPTPAVSTLEVVGVNDPTADVAPARIGIYPKVPASVEVTSPTAILISSTTGAGTLVRTVEDPHTVAGRLDARSALTATFTANPFGPVEGNGPTPPMGPVVVRILLVIFLATIPWFAVLVAGRNSLGTASARVRRVAGAAAGLLTAHLFLRGMNLSSLAEARWSASLEQRLVTWLGEEHQLFLSTKGFAATPIILLAALLVVAPLLVGTEPARRRGRIASGPLVLTPLFLAAVAAAVGATLWLAGEQTGVRPILLWSTVAGASLVVVMAALALAALLASRRAPVLWAAAFVLPLAVLSETANRSGVLPGVLRLGVPFLAVTLTCLALVELVRGIGLWRSSRSVPSGVALLVVVALAAAPWGLRGREYPWTWNGTGLAAARVDGLLVVALIVVVAAGLRVAGLRPVRAADSLRRMRWAGIALLTPVLATHYSFVRSPTITVLLAALAGAWWLLPRSGVDIERRRLQLPRQARAEAVEAVVYAGEERRVARLARKKIDEKGGEDLPQGDRRSTLLAMDARTRAQDVGGLPALVVAFGGGTSDSPWQRARRGALAGTVVGLPWTAAAVYGALPQLPLDDTYPVLATLAALLPVLLRWTAFGLVGAYFFPLVRGRTGFTKALSFFAASALPSVVDTILSHPGRAGWENTVLVVVQLAAFWTTLGLLADREVLLRHGRDARGLVDVHNLSALAAWSSSVVVAAGTAVVTAALAGLTPFVTGLVAPTPTPPAPPAPSAPPTTGPASAPVPRLPG